MTDFVETAFSGGLYECMFCGEEYDPDYSDADRPNDYCCAEHQRLAFGDTSGGTR